MTACVERHNGAPTLLLDGQPVFAGYLWCGRPGTETFGAAPVARRFAEAGIHLYAFDMGSEWCGPRPGQRGHFDFSEVEARLRNVLGTDPEARFHLRVHLERQRANDWWVQMYPEECELDSEGQRLSQSFASGVWREQAKAFLRALVEHVRDIGMADRVIAYQTGAGGTGEWVKGTSVGPTGDYSQPMRAHFRKWLRERYGGDVSALRAAWADPDAAFEQVQVPSADEQLQTQHTTFRDPLVEQKAIDYYRCLAELCGGLVTDFGRTVKEATGGQALAGAFFGYLLELNWNDAFFGGGVASKPSAYQRSGHLGLREVLDSPYVDFIVSPYSYFFRGLGGDGAPMPPTESASLHGKLYLLEDDTRTHLAERDAGYGRLDSLGDSIAVLKRNVAQVLTRGLGIWWLGARGHVEAAQEPAFAPLLRRFQELGTFALALDRAPKAEIAVLVDDESFLYESVRNDLSLPLISQQRVWGLPRVGAPFDVFMLQDFAEGRVPAARLCIFLNAFRLDRDRRQAVARELRRDGRVAVWVYAPGYIDDDLSLDHMADLTGFRFGKGDRPWGPLMHITDFQHPMTADLPEDLFWGTNNSLGPIFHLDDEDARVLGEVVYSEGRCKPGLGVKTFPEWTSIYVAAPNIPAPVLRGIARFAGVHLYSEAGDVLYATAQLLGVHTLRGGERSFALPRRVQVVYDLFEGSVVARDTSGFQVMLSPASTSLYYTGDVQPLESLASSEANQSGASVRKEGGSRANSR